MCKSKSNMAKLLMENISLIDFCSTLLSKSNKPKLRSYNSIIIQLFQLGNSSEIMLAAGEEDHNTSLVCTAFNPLLPSNKVESVIPIIIHCRYCNYYKDLSISR